MESSLGERLGAIRGGMRGDRSASFGTKIGRLLFVAAGLIVLLVLLPSTVTYINPGHVGILIHRAGGGVDPKPMGPGLHPRNPLLSQIEEYPVYMQTLVLTRGSTEGSRANDEINRMREARDANRRLVADFVDTGKNRAMLVAYRFAGFREIMRHGREAVLESTLDRVPETPPWVSLSVGRER